MFIMQLYKGLPFNTYPDTAKPVPISHCFSIAVKQRFYPDIPENSIRKDYNDELLSEIRWTVMIQIRK